MFYSPYKCPFCPKCYAHSTDLRRHRRTHGLEEKRFSCEFCQKAFYESKFLRSHLKTNHRDQSQDAATKPTARNNVISTAMEISNLDECLSEEYIDYEYVHSD